MAEELEVSVLDIDAKTIQAKLRKLGAKKTQQSRLIVDWYREKGTKEGKEPWYLRIRSYSDGRHEVTWKAKSSAAGVARTHKEINFEIPDKEAIADLFVELGLEAYAHQEKDRTSFSLKSCIIDIDQYPGMPVYMEIEGRSEASVRGMMRLLGVENNRTWNQGERKLIQQIYSRDWYDMRF